MVLETKELVEESSWTYEPNTAGTSRRELVITRHQVDNIQHCVSKEAPPNMIQTTKMQPKTFRVYGCDWHVANLRLIQFSCYSTLSAFLFREGILYISRARLSGALAKLGDAELRASTRPLAPCIAKDTGCWLLRVLHGERRRGFLGQ